ncbi:DNA repair protein XRCC1 [Drosophila teissieri]|uniref:DNA repair protein XRCC1 n=1 Tax=Drosophila teissieri TaxID=7243 RepID=UPI001CBA0EEB|nr:DNA repair protein XRCC1 [Drosophila teissieri]
MPIAVFKSVREVSSEDAVHVAENLLKENAGKKWRTKAAGEKSAYVVLEFAEPQQITGIDIGNEHAAFIEVLVSRTGCQADDFRELLLSSSFMTPIESKNSSNPNRVRCFSGPALAEAALPEKWKLLKIVCTQPFNRHVPYGLSFVKVHVVAAAAPKVKSLLPQGVMQFGAFKLREESPDSETDSQVNRFHSWKKETQHKAPAAQISTAAAIRDAGSSALRRLSIGRVSSLAASPSPSPKPSPKPSPSPSPVPSGQRSGSPTPSEAKPLDRNRASLLFGDDDEDEADDAGDAKKHRLSKHLEADKDRRRLEQEKERESRKKKSSRHSLDKSSSKEDKPPAKEHKSSSREKSTPKEDKHSRKEERSHSKEEKSRKEEKSKHAHRSLDTSNAKESSRPSAQKRHSSPTAVAVTPAKKQKVMEKAIQYRPFNQLLKGVLLVISGIQNPDRADLRAKAVALGAKYKADWEPGCTHLICAFKNTPKYNQVKGKGKIVTRSWIEKCYELKKYLPWRRYALDTNDFGQPESDEELCDEATRPRRDSNENDVDMLEESKLKNTYDSALADQNKMDLDADASSGIDTEDELQRVAESNVKKAKLRTPAQTKSRDIYEVSTDEEDYLVLKKKQIHAGD